MPLPTEPIGSIPRPTSLLAAMSAYATGGISREQLHATKQAALRDTITLFERTGSPIGVPDKTIQAILRHSNLSTARNVCAKTVLADSTSAMEHLERVCTGMQRAEGRR